MQEVTTTVTTFMNTRACSLTPVIHVSRYVVHMDSLSNIEELCVRIYDAWSDVPKPEAGRIIVDHAEDECDIREYFRNTSQREHDPGELAKLSSAFTFFTRSAWHYWLPAFMVAALRTDGDIDVSTDRLALSFVDQESRSRVPLLSLRQRHLVGEYLRLRSAALSCSNAEVEAFRTWSSTNAGC